MRANTGAKTVAAIVEGRGETVGPPQDSRQAAVAAADALATCWPQLLQRLRGEALKDALLAEVAKVRPGLEKPFIERCAERAATPTQR